MSSKIIALTEENIRAAANRLKAGELVAIPTETVYGLAADASNDEAVASVFRLKGRPSFNPLICHVADGVRAEDYARMTPLAKQLAKQFWPGALTLVLERQSDAPVSWLATAGLDTVAIRVSSHPVMRQVIEAFGGAIAAPSANRSNRISPTMASDVLEEFPDCGLPILDGGPSNLGLESTVVNATGDVPVLLRHGSITSEAIAEVAGEIRFVGREETDIQSPGMLARHYAPETPLRLNVTEIRPGEALLAFGRAVPEGAARVLQLSESGNLGEAAARLFGALRQLDREQWPSIAVMPIPDEGLGRAINDRLRRAVSR